MCALREYKKYAALRHIGKVFERDGAKTRQVFVSERMAPP